jgi:hypothetical protein
MKDRIEESKKYLLYTYEQFLQDDFFISSIINPTPETEKFWDKFEHSCENLQEYLAAKNHCLIFAAQQIPLTDQEEEELWDGIVAQNTHIRKKHKLYYVSMAAACIGIILISTLAIKSLMNKDRSTDITTFAAAHKADTNGSDQTQLILSRNKTILLNEQDAEVIYDSANIQTNEERLSKSQYAGYNQLIVPYGKRSSLTFSDGTKVWVNSGSRLIYPAEFAKDKREVYVDGEIYIEVFKDKKRPFFVKTKNMDVRVLGTKFNVMSYDSDDQQSVVLLSGSVQVETAKKPKTLLVPNQMFQTKGQLETVSQVNVDDYVSWTKGLYNFNSEELGSIFKRLSRFYGVKIICDSETAQLKCSGKLDLKDNLETILKDFSFLAPVSAVKENGEFRIERRKN